MTHDNSDNSTPLKCLEVIDKCKHHSIDPTAAAKSIVEILRSDDKVPRDDSNETGIADIALLPYMAMLQQLDTSKTVPRSSTGRGSTIRDEEEQQEGRASDEDDDRDEEDGVNVRDQDGDARAADGVDTTSPKDSLRIDISRKQPDEKLYPWKSRSTPVITDPNLAKTLRLKANYLRDLKRAKADILSHPDCPRFPNSLWSDLLANKYIDFGKLLGHIKAVKPSAQLIERIGDIEISTGAISEPISAIANQGHWTSAFAIYRKAVLFAYPHRGDELDSYYERIISMFNATQESDHFRILNYDRSVRLNAGDTNSVSLRVDPLQQFDTQFMSHLLPSGVGTTSSRTNRFSRGGKVTTKRSAPICRNWNYRACGGCNYRHCCLQCQSFEHRLDQCPEQPSTSAREESSISGRKPGVGGRQQAGPRA